MCDFIILKGYYVSQNHHSIFYRFKNRLEEFDKDLLNGLDRNIFNKQNVPKDVVKKIIDNYSFTLDDCDVTEYRWEIYHE